MENFKTLQWIGDVNGVLELTDQRKLPVEFCTVECRTVKQLFDAIRTLTVRGAPAIGVAAGFGVCLAAQEIDGMTISEAVEHVEKRAELLSESRPTAVNLFWALKRMKDAARNFVAAKPGAKIYELKACLLSEAQKIYDEDVEMCKNIGINGAAFMPDGGAVLTHCNAGALATAGDGTALSPIFEAHRNGKNFKVYADETRPLLQGARLTAWELKQAGIDVTVICDNMAGYLMGLGEIEAVIVGADRIASNGDVANKIGTYSLSILAKVHDIPFYIAAPSSTFDMSIKSGAEIPIEQRGAYEVSCLTGTMTAPKDVKVFNPAFDVTPAKNITAIITEKAVIENPDAEKIARILGR